MLWQTENKNSIIKKKLSRENITRLSSFPTVIQTTSKYRKFKKFNSQKYSVKLLQWTGIQILYRSYRLLINSKYEKNYLTIHIS